MGVGVWVCGCVCVCGCILKSSTSLSVRCLYISGLYHVKICSTSHNIIQCFVSEGQHLFSFPSHIIQIKDQCLDAHLPRHLHFSVLFTAMSIPCCFLLCGDHTTHSRLNRDDIGPTLQHRHQDISTGTGLKDIW